MAVFRQY